ncbi:MAG: PBP1A family penicillin-binding protein [Polyangia bacterium]|jgi:penicillin-binding protein 1A|nr:PBP1A family penicillin-binding protein [Polyangia bacterium]
MTKEAETKSRVTEKAAPARRPASAGGGGEDARRRALRIGLRVSKWIGLFALLGALAGIGFLAALFAVYGADAELPDLRSLQRLKTKQVTRVLAADGHTLIGEIYDERRSLVPLERLPKVLVDAVVAAEDARFFEHEGLNLLGMMRAFFANLRAGRYAQGGSTITQQVVKTFLLSSERTLRRKVQEVILARRLEQTLTKEQILELYLNQIYFGHGRYGVQEASRFYFGKDVEKIGLAEASILAGLPQSPERLSPIKHPRRAKERQRYVLRQMVKTKKISSSEAERVSGLDLPIGRTSEPEGALCSEYVTAVRQRLVARFGQAALPTLGLTVVTTCDLRLQRAARKALEEGLRELDKRQRTFPGRPLSPSARQALLKELARSQGERPVPGRVYRGIVTRIDDQAGTAMVSLGLAEGEMDLQGDRRYNPRGLPPSKVVSLQSMVHVVAMPAPKGQPVLPLRLASGPQGALVVLDVANREIRAMVGGYGQRVGDFNRAIEAQRQPGSAFKPIYYAAALEDRKITPALRLPDSPHPCENWLNIRARGDKAYLGQLGLRAALAKSVNSIACRVYERVGNQRTRELALRMGIRSSLTEHLSLALGASGVRPLEMAGAFAVFAGGGKYLEPRMVRQMGSLPEDRPEASTALSPEASYVVTSLLTSVVRSGTGARAAKVGGPVAGKTGTSNQNRDAWFVGYTPELVAAVWVGHDDYRPLGPGETGGRAAVPIWVSFVKQALGKAGGRDFPVPPAVVFRHVDPQTGHAVAEGTPGAQRECFLPGTAPEPATSPAVDPGDHVMQDDEE